MDVRTARHDGFDRIVFEFSGNPPDYRLEYIEPPIVADPSGLPIEIAGDAFLWVRFEPANAHDDDGNPTFSTGELTPGLPALLEVERIGDFEAVVSYVLGLSEEVDFRVAALDEPYRLAIDVEHP